MAKGNKDSRSKKPAPRKGRRGWLWKMFNWGTTLFIWGAIAVFSLLAYYAYSLPDISDLNQPARKATVTVLARDGVEIAQFGTLSGDYVQLRDLPPHLPQAVIATEDRRFYNHFGIDIFGLARAAWTNLRAGRIRQGGSTITQQLAKNLYLTPERSLKRKAQEFLLALWLEADYSKDEILTLYLNRVYLGAGTFGVDAASRKYFDKPATDVTLTEAAMLAGLLKAPSRYAPTNDLNRSQGRARQVIRNMVAAGYLTEEGGRRAEASPARLATSAGGLRNALYFADWILERVRDHVGRTERDLVVTTTLDRNIQLQAEKSLEQGLAKEGARRNAGQAALLAMSPDGAVRAMVGGRDYRASSYNRAASARRQPGSAFKLFVYLAALESGYSPDDRMTDRPVTVEGWSPRNYSGKYRGEVTLREAYARSLNTVAVQLAEKVGRGKILDAARRLGIGDELRNHPSLALGTSEVSLFELTGAYASLANEGRAVLPYGLLEIREAGGGVIWRRAGSGPGQVIASGDLADLQDLNAAAMEWGTAKGAKIGRPAGGKTGTSQDFRDAWFIGFTPGLVAGIWVGNDDNSAMKGVTGGGLPTRIWRDFMIGALRDAPVEDFRRPSVVQDIKSLWQKIIDQFGSEPAPAPTPRDQPARDNQFDSEPAPAPAPATQDQPAWDNKP